MQPDYEYQCWGGQYEAVRHGSMQVWVQVWYEEIELSPWYRSPREKAIIRRVSCWWTEDTSRQIVICLTFIIILAEWECEIEDHFLLTVHRYLHLSFPTQQSHFISYRLSLTVSYTLLFTFLIKLDLEVPQLRSEWNSIRTESCRWFAFIAPLH